MLYSFSLPINVLTLALPFAGGPLRHHFPTLHALLAALSQACVHIYVCACNKVNLSDVKKGLRLM